MSSVCIQHGCLNLKELLNNINKYNRNQLEIHQTNNLRDINNYHHCIQYHSGHDDLENILKKLDYCDIKLCTKLNNNNIMDMMHSYFQHSFDIGNRISSLDRQAINSADSTNESIKTAKKLMNMKTRVHNVAKLSERFAKYNQLHNDNDKKEETKEQSANSNKYKFGNHFFYGYDGEIEQHDSINVILKYDGLKEELLNNKTAIISLDNYDNEYAKALLYLQSFYCKKYFIAKESNGIKFTMGHMLSLMIY
eukprot:329153_1